MPTSCSRTWLRNVFKCLVLMFLPLFVVQACTFWRHFRSPEVKCGQVEIDASPDANDDAPVALDFVVARDEEQQRLLAGRSAADWFASREQWMAEHGKDAAVWRYEVVPGQHLVIDPAPFCGTHGLALFAFASYIQAGAHRLRLDGFDAVVLKLEGARVRLVPVR